MPELIAREDARSGFSLRRQGSYLSGHQVDILLQSVPLLMLLDF
jgi:hypothetical protein